MEICCKWNMLRMMVGNAPEIVSGIMEVAMSESKGSSSNRD